MLPDLTIDELARFRTKIDTSGTCHVWTGETNNKGYGRFVVYRNGSRIRILAHRLAFALAHGREPETVTRHSCDNPPCCNPDHLGEGSQLSNVRDCIRRGRHDSSGLKAYVAARDARADALAAAGVQVCSRCWHSKPLTEFTRNRCERNGHNRWCKSCYADHKRSRQPLRVSGDAA